jgi:hypothetical protein
MKEKTDKVTNMLDKLANALEDKTLASNEIEQAKQEIAKVRGSFDEPMLKINAMQFDTQNARAQVLQMVEKQATILKSVHPIKNDPTALIKNRAMLLKKKPYPLRLRPP